MILRIRFHTVVANHTGVHAMQPITQMSTNGELVAVASADGTVRVADLKVRHCGGADGSA